MSENDSPLRPKKYIFEFEGKPQAILEVATNIAGIDLNYLGIKLALETGTFPDYKNISIEHWMKACELLTMDMSSIQYGYNSFMHKVQLGESYYLGKSELPKSPELKQIFREYKKHIKVNRKYEYNMYGKRLRFKKMRDNFLKDMKYFFLRNFNFSKSVKIKRDQEKISTAKMGTVDNFVF